MKLVFILLFFLCVSVSAQNLSSKDSSFNPKTGVNLMFLNQNSDLVRTGDGMKMQEAEIQFSSDVDAYFTSRFLLAIEPSAGVYEVSPEEAVIESVSIPNLTLKVGKSKLAFGKHNHLHTHAFPFINAPLQNEEIFGEEGLNEVGVGVSGLLPLSWFSELSLDFVQGENSDLFNSSDRRSGVFSTRYKNLWDVSNESTFEIGVSGASGKNSNELSTKLFGADITLKWKPSTGGKYTSFEWSTEYLQKDREGASDGQLSGVVSYFKYQFAQRWWAQYRYDYLGLNETKVDPAKIRNTFLVAFLPTEFSGVRLQYENIINGQPQDEKRISLQFTVSLGAHPAHSY